MPLQTQNCTEFIKVEGERKRILRCSDGKIHFDCCPGELFCFSVAAFFYQDCGKIRYCPRRRQIVLADQAEAIQKRLPCVCLALGKSPLAPLPTPAGRD